MFIAGPVLTLWKEREPVYRRRHARIAAENGGIVPAYATGSASEQVDTDAAKRKLRRGGRLTSPDDPEQGVSREEFEELVRDLHVDPVPRGRGAVADPPKPKTKAAKPAAPALDESADALPEDVTMPPAPKDGAAAPKRPKGSSAAAKRRSKHGRPR